MTHPRTEILQGIIDGKQIQYLTVDGWTDCNYSSAFARMSQGICGQQLRIKPPEPVKPVMINGHEISPPMTNVTLMYEEYYVASPADRDFYVEYQFGLDDYEEHLRRGLCHETKEAAIVHAKALLSFTEVK